MAQKEFIVTKKEIIERIFGSLNSVSDENKDNKDISKSLLEKIINSFFSELESSVLNGECVSFSKYFSIWTAVSKPRTAINMITKETMHIPSKVVAKMKFSNTFKEKVAKGKANVSN